MGQLNVNGERAVDRPYEQVFDALLRLLPELGLQLDSCDREDGQLTALPIHPVYPHGELSVRLARLPDERTHVAVQSRLLRFHGVAHVARHERSIQRLLTRLAAGSIRNGGRP